MTPTSKPCRGPAVGHMPVGNSAIIEAAVADTAAAGAVSSGGGRRRGRQPVCQVCPVVQRSADGQYLRQRSRQARTAHLRGAGFSDNTLTAASPVPSHGDPAGRRRICGDLPGLLGIHIALAASGTALFSAPLPTSVCKSPVMRMVDFPCQRRRSFQTKVEETHPLNGGWV